MSSLREVIVFTPNLDSMREFYEGGVGLAAAHAETGRIAFDTGGATLALHGLAGAPASSDPTGLAGAGEREIELVFESFSIDADVERLRTRGVDVGEGRPDGSGRRVRFRDLEGTPLLLRPGGGPGDEDGRERPAVTTVIVNCSDLLAMVIFYRERLGLKIAYEAPHWVEFDAGDTRLALHARPSGLNHPLHAAQRVAYCLETPDLDTWVDEMRARGLHFATAPIEEEFGLYAEALDPDGNVVVFREPRSEPPIEEELAEAFESDEVPHLVAIRKPVLKGGKAVSRVALKPEYTEHRGGRIKPEPGLAAIPEPRPAIPSVRGGGPDRTRQRPKTVSDTRRVKAKPAIGRSKKAAQKSAVRKQSATAEAGKSRPVKRAVARAASSMRSARASRKAAARPAAKSRRK
jgi:catechol 2,3-dioxygenase-like lactoylglutathione lyase family enzyme